MQSGEEWVVLAKTRADLFDEAAALIGQHHPDEVPAILAIPLANASAAFADWIASETRD